jgi:hypothetical protein
MFLQAVAAPTASCQTPAQSTGQRTRTGVRTIIRRSSDKFRLVIPVCSIPPDAARYQPNIDLHRIRWRYPRRSRPLLEYLWSPLLRWWPRIRAYSQEFGTDGGHRCERLVLLISVFIQTTVKSLARRSPDGLSGTPPKPRTTAPRARGSTQLWGTAVGVAMQNVQDVVEPGKHATCAGLQRDRVASTKVIRQLARY